MKKNNKGFTLIEIISVIIIIGIISLIAVPAISQYVEKSKNTALTAYEKSMEAAAKNQIVKCLEGNEKCNLPKEDNKIKIYLSELIDEGYIDEMKNPETSEFCESFLSYVEVENIGNDYEYTACLFCGDYTTQRNACTDYDLDENDPICGEATGSSTRWTKDNRTISVRCSDNGSGCTKDVFSKTFSRTTKESTITIVDNSGRTKMCEVNAYVDKTPPTCELEVKEGTYLAAYGWYYGDSIKVGIRSYYDGDSGIVTYGMGTSINNKDYNKKMELEVREGITTVIGYVKDTAGNEGYCSLDVRVGGGKPEFNHKYGYQVYPKQTTDNLTYTLSGITEGSGYLETTSTVPKITLTNLSKYRNVEKVVITLSQGIPSTTTGTVTPSGGSAKTAIMTKDATEVVFDIEKGTYENIEIRLGTISGKKYYISKIELMTSENNIWTNKPVSVNIYSRDIGIATTSATFDNGSNWQPEMSKSYSSNTSNVIKTKNQADLISDPANFSITGIDTSVPSCTLKITSGTLNGTGTAYISDVRVEFDTYTDSGGSGVLTYGIDSLTGGTYKDYSANGTYDVTGYIADNAGNISTCSISFTRASS